MKSLSAAVVLLVLASTSHARAPKLPAQPAAAQPTAAQPTAAQPAATPVGAAPLASSVFDWNELPVEARPNGVRRAVLDGQTQTLDRLHAHITTLNPGQTSGEPRLHEQEEVIIVKEGSIEARYDGQKRQAGPGSIIFFAAHAVTSLANVGPSPATYYVLNYYPRLTPRPGVGAAEAPR